MPRENNCDVLYKTLRGVQQLSAFNKMARIVNYTFVNFLRKLSNKKTIIKQSGHCILAIFWRVGQGNIQVHSVFIM